MPPPAGRALRCSHRRSRPRQCSLLANAARSLRALPCSRPLHGRQAGTGAPLFPALALYMEGKPAPKSLLARPLHGRQAGAQIAARPPSTWKASWHPNHCSRTGSACSLLANAARSAPRSPCSRPLHGRWSRCCSRSACTATAAPTASGDASARSKSRLTRGRRSAWEWCRPTRARSGHRGEAWQAGVLDARWVVLGEGADRGRVPGRGGGRDHLLHRAE
ncbi:hypothetical protein ZEAMMB73_Zm00001d012902 [Zea mays]|uniref:Uncharacterized protein n=1 Tax=Zea mays TaxID=4577 RepID=A0A1D6GDT8_MAIZE|nr:hypothetical protein ZEAMMB73_Zm00001d012902 [Zea mays]